MDSMSVGDVVVHVKSGQVGKVQVVMPHLRASRGSTHGIRMVMTGEFGPLYVIGGNAEFIKKL